MTGEQIDRCRAHTLGALAAVGREHFKDPVLRAVALRFRTLAHRAIAYPSIQAFAEVERCRDWLGQVLGVWRGLGLEIVP